MDRTEHLKPLGLQRSRILSCLGGDFSSSPGYFDPRPDVDVLVEFREYVTAMSAKWSDPTEPTLAAARFLTGEIAAADVVLNKLPDKSFKLDHGMGNCVLAPMWAVAVSLPLPDELKETRRWQEDSAVLNKVRTWLADHRDRLRWDNVAGVYRLEVE